jgi:predicted RecA/RadA family phage recombinase
MKNYEGDWQERTAVAPEGGVTSGVPIVIGDTFGIPNQTALEGESFTLVVAGRFRLPKSDEVAFDDGVSAYWDEVAGEVTDDNSKLPIGTTYEEAAEEATDVGVTVLPASVNDLELTGKADLSTLIARIALPVADLAALKAVAEANLQNGALYLCATLGLYRYASASEAAGDDTDTVVPTAVGAGAGRFLRIAPAARAHQHVNADLTELAAALLLKADLSTLIARIALPVADLAALKAVAEANLQNGALYLCATLGLYRYASASEAAGDDTDTVVPTAVGAGAGRFLRIAPAARAHQHVNADLTELAAALLLKADLSTLIARIALPVADLAALKAVAEANLQNGALYLCATLGLYRYSSASEAAGDDTDTVVPTAVGAGAGRFLRIAPAARAHTHANADLTELAAALLLKADLSTLIARIALPVADLAALKAVAEANLQNGALYLCATLGLYRYSSASEAAGDDTDTVVPTAVGAGAGRFLRLIGLTAQARLTALETATFPLAGEATLTGVETTKAVTFVTPLADANYSIQLTQGALTGSAVGSEAPWYSSKANTGFTINIATAPGGTDTTKVDWTIQPYRNP